MDVDLKLTRREATERLHLRRLAAVALIGGAYLRQRRFMEWAEHDVGFVERFKDGTVAYTEGPDEIGLRYLGMVEAEVGNRRRYSDSDGAFSNRDVCGWCTDPDGHHSKDGEGLVWGVVYLLPGRAGKTRLIAGYRFGGYGGGLYLDLNKVFEDRVMEGELKTCDIAYWAARHADGLAEEVADDEREYQLKEREEQEKEEREQEEEEDA
jgi:hypothetical protein